MITEKIKKEAIAATHETSATFCQQTHGQKTEKWNPTWMHFATLQGVTFNEGNTPSFMPPNNEFMKWQTKRVNKLIELKTQGGEPCQ